MPGKVLEVASSALFAARAVAADTVDTVRRLTLETGRTTLSQPQWHPRLPGLTGSRPLAVTLSTSTTSAWAAAATRSAGKGWSLHRSSSGVDRRPRHTC